MKADFEATVEKNGQGDVLVVKIRLEEPTRSASGKTLTVASTRGNKTTDVLIGGKPVVIGLNAYIKP